MYWYCNRENLNEESWIQWPISSKAQRVCNVRRVDSTSSLSLSEIFQRIQHHWHTLYWLLSKISRQGMIIFVLFTPHHTPPLACIIPHSAFYQVESLNPVKYAYMINFINLQIYTRILIIKTSAPIGQQRRRRRRHRPLPLLLDYIC